MTITMDRPPTAPPAAPPNDPPFRLGGGGSENHEPEREPTDRTPYGKIVGVIFLAFLLFIVVASLLSGQTPLPAGWVPLT